MKTIIFGILSLLFLNVNAEIMKSPEQVVVQLFVATDQRDWQKVEASFVSEVLLDYSSMTGNPASKLTPSQIITS